MRAVILILLFLTATTTFARKFDIKLFTAICDGLLLNQEYNSIRPQLKGVYIIADPVTDTSWISYEGADSLADMNRLMKYSDAEKMAILFSEPLPILPLKDTVYIIDTLGLFNQELEIKKGQHTFKLTKAYWKKSADKENSLYLKAIKFDGDKILAAFSFSGNMLLYTCTLIIKDNAISFYKSSIIDMATIKGE